MSRSKTDPWSIPSYQDFHIAGLAHGLIFPQKGLLNSRFFKNKGKADDVYGDKCSKDIPNFIRVLVGTKRALQEWFKSAGPGSCSLWAEIAEEDMSLSKPDTLNRLFKGQLHMAYRLRSATPLVLPVFPDMHLILSPQVSQEEGSFKIQGEAFGNPACGKWHSLRQREKQKFLKSIGVNYLGDYFCVGHGQAHQGLLQSENWIRRWLLGLPVVLYRQLTSMIIPGGSLWQFQQLVERIVHKPFFVDVDFELIDFRLWLESHDYITILESSDFLIVLSTLQWTVVRFNFSEDDHIMITGDRCLTSLQQLWQEKKRLNQENQGSQINNGVLHPSDVNNFGCPQARKWKFWHSPDQNCSRHGTSLLDAMCNEGGFSESRFADAFRQDFGFLVGVQEHNSRDLSFGRSGIQELRSCHLNGSPVLSSKERCALSNLGSSSRTVRQRGIHILLDILQGELKGKRYVSLVDFRSDSVNGRGTSTPVSGSSVSCAINESTSRSGELSSIESSRALLGTEKGENVKVRDLHKKQLKLHLNVQNDGLHSKGSPLCVHDIRSDSSESQPESDAQGLPLSSGSMCPKESEGFEFSKLFRLFCEGQATLQEKFGHSEVSPKLEAVQMKLLDWVQGGFLEGLIEETICSPGKAFSRGEAVLGVEETADICLKITSALPADSSSHIINTMMKWLRDCSIDRDLLNCIVDNSGLKLRENLIDLGDHSHDRDIIIQTVRENLEQVWCSAKLLLLLIRGSTFIASSFSRCGGLALILEIYTCLVKLGMLKGVETNFPVSEMGGIQVGQTLPGVVLECKKQLVKVPSFSISFFSNLRHLQPLNSDTPRSIPCICDQTIKYEERKRDNCKDFACRIFKKVGHALLFIFLCRGSRLLVLVKSKLGNSRGFSSVVPGTFQEACKEGLHCLNGSDSKTIQLSPVEKLVSSSETRPKVPKLLLRPCLSEDRRKVCDQAGKSLMNMGTLSGSCLRKRPSETSHDCCAMVLEAKVYLLEAYIVLLLQRSAAAVAAQQEVLSKLPRDIQTIISIFMIDLFSCLKSFPQSNAKRLQGLIFEVMYQLDKLLFQKNSEISVSFIDNDSRRELAYECYGAPSVTGTLKMVIIETFVREALESFRKVISSVSLLPNKNKIDGCLKKCDSASLTSDTWQSLTTLMCILAECHMFFNKKGLQCLLLEEITGLFEGAFSLFSELQEPSSWSLHQILAMQSLLHLTNVIFQGLRNDTSYLSQLWTDSEEGFWQIIVHNKKNWTCMTGYLSWFILESCHGCFKNLLNYWMFCSDIPEALAILLFSKPEFCLESPGFGCLRDSFECLGFFVSLFHRRVCVQSANGDNSLLLSLPEDMAVSLDFLMNPVHGLIMSTLKGPCFQGRTIHTERDIDRHALGCRMVAEEHTSLLRASHEVDVSPSCKLSSGKFSITSLSDLGSSTRILTEKSPSERLATQVRCGIKSWRLHTPNAFKVMNGPTYGMDSEGIGNQRSSSLESSDHSTSSRLEHSQCLCKTCATSLTAQSLSLRVSMLIEQRSLELLTQVFGLRFIPEVSMKQPHEEKPARMIHNPFASRKYVDAFLDFHFLSFLQLYNWKTDQKASKQQALLKLIDCTYQVPEEEGSRNLDAIGTIQNASQNGIPSCLSEEETITMACRKHGEVILSLAQNQTGDVSRRFKELRVMDFLMHQIALEYELSHVVTPRELFCELVSSGALRTETQKLVDYAMSKSRSEKKTPEGKSFMPKEKTAEDASSSSICSTRVTRQVVQEKDINQLVDVKTLGRMNISGGPQRRISERILDGIDPDSARLLQSAGSVERNPTRQHHLLSCISILQQPVDQHGFFTCRAGATPFRCRLPFSVKGECLPVDIDTNCHMLLLRRQELINFYFGLPAVAPHSLKQISVGKKALRQQPREIPVEKKSFSKCSDKSHKQCSCLDLHHYESSSFLFNEESCESTGKLDHRKDLSLLSFKSSSISKHMDDKNFDTTIAIPDKVTGSYAFVYSGRFCDLNEEVENQLAREDAEICLPKESCPPLNNMVENASLKSGRKNLAASLKPTSSADQLKQKLSVTRRPLVPKLNLPKSARKGDEPEKPMELDENGFHINKRKASENQQPKDLPTINEQVSGAGHSAHGSKMIGLSYGRERMKRRIYRDCKLHALLLELFVSLMITPQGSLETCYTDRFPMDGQNINAPFYLLYHINHAANSEIRPLLRKRIKNFHPSVFRILKLLWRDLFDSSLYTNRKRIAHGAFAQIYTATLTQRDGGNVDCKSVVLKTVDLPKGPLEPCKFFDIYSEVEILEKFTGDSRVCQLLDYGVDIESFILVLKHYKCSLRHWRQHNSLQCETSGDTETNKLSEAFKNKLPLYLEIYSAVLQAVKVLESHNVVHYDLKCDNILLEPVEGLHSEEEFWNPAWSKLERSHLPFRVCIADFGQSKASILKGGECTVRNRGTECVKSPEMLKLLCTSKQDEAIQYSPPKIEESVGRAVDVWGLGCLLYELLTGEYLLYDEDWTRFFIRVTLPSEGCSVSLRFLGSTLLCQILWTDWVAQGEVYQAACFITLIVSSTS